MSDKYFEILSGMRNELNDLRKDCLINFDKTKDMLKLKKIVKTIKEKE